MLPPYNNSTPSSPSSSVAGGLGLSNPFTNIPRLSRSIGAFIVLLFIVCSFLPSAIDFIALVPGRTLGYPFLVYNVFSSAFLELTLFSMLLNVASLLLMGKQLEPLWSSLEFAKFIGIVGAVSGVATYWLIVISFMITRNEGFLFNTSWYGFAGLNAAFLVGIKQVNPEQEIRLLLLLPVKVKYLPTLFGLIALLGAILNVPGAMASLPFVVFGTYFGWVYLRFFKRTQGVIGDQSDAFGLDSFFPFFLSKYVQLFGNLTYRLVGLSGVWKKFGPESQSQSLPSSVNSNSLDAQRRRKRAAESLEKRLAEKNLLASSSPILSDSGKSDSSDEAIPVADEPQ